MLFFSYSRNRRKDKVPLSSAKFNGRMHNHKMETDSFEENGEIKHGGGFHYSVHNSIQQAGKGEFVVRSGRERQAETLKLTILV